MNVNKLHKLIEINETKQPQTFSVCERCTYRCDDTRCCIIYNFDLLMMSTLCSKHVEAYNKLIIKQDFVLQVG